MARSKKTQEKQPETSSTGAEGTGTKRPAVPIHTEYLRQTTVKGGRGAKKKADNSKPRLVPTRPDIEGPFYKPGAPERFCLLPDGQECDLLLTGKVLDCCGDVVAGAVLDFWQADAKGNYDNEGFDLRGKQKSAQDGSYCLKTIRPGHYAISDDEFRCSHLHVKVSAPGCKPLTTQLYFPDDEQNPHDRWFDSLRVVAFPDAASPREGVFNFILEKNSTEVVSSSTGTKTSATLVGDKGQCLPTSTPAEVDPSAALETPRSMDVVKAMRVEAEEIVVACPKSGRRISMVANEQIAGVWIESAKRDQGPVVCIYHSGDSENGNEQVCVGIYASGQKVAVNVGLSVSSDGTPMIQMLKQGDDAGNVHFFGIEELKSK